MDKLLLNNRTALVTGSNRGIGYSIMETGKMGDGSMDLGGRMFLKNGGNASGSMTNKP